MIDLQALVIGWLADEPTLTRHDLVERIRDREPLLDGATVADAVDRTMARATALGPLADLFATPGITEVMINGDGPVWIDGEHGLEATSWHLSGEEIEVIIDRILDPLGLRVDRTSPVVDARLPDGSRVNVVVPPLALNGPIVTIRRFGTRCLGLDAFASGEVVELLKALVRERATMLVAGGTGTGKTTLLNALGQWLPQDERVVVIEDTSELRLTGNHIVPMEARPANSEGVGAFTIRQLVKNSLRMRPDRLVIGEVRGAESLDLLLALNTGHAGSLATCHANSCDAALRRIETLSLMAEVELPLAAIRQQLGAAIDVVVHIERDASGQRRIASIGEVTTDSTPTCVELWPGLGAEGSRPAVRRALAAAR